MEILYIEDDIDDIELFQEAISHIDPTICFISASSFSDTLTKLARNTSKPDAIFVDYHLPGVDGYVMCKRFKK